MARHEFALLDHIPLPGVRYDAYEGDHLICISVHDDFIERRLWDFMILPCYAHTVDIPIAGLCYCGITLIPPQAAREMAWMVRFDPALSALAQLCDRAAAENKYIIHFGL